MRMPESLETPAASQLRLSAAVTISGIGLAAKIRKHQFKVDKLPGRPKTIPAIWTGVVAA
jgi:hypothetical protein